MRKNKSTVAPIYFNVSQAREQLLGKGIVYTCRHKKRHINNQVTIARRGTFKKYVELARVNVTYEGSVRNPQKLKPYLKESGFITIKEWVSQIKDGLPAHLYKVRVVSTI